MNPLLDPVQVGEILGISPRTVNDLCNRKKLRYIQVDAKHRRFTESMVQEYIDSQTVQVEKPAESKPRKQQTRKTTLETTKPAKIDDIREEVASWLS
jgi:excisionase family DNA binding protein